MPVPTLPNQDPKPPEHSVVLQSLLRPANLDPLAKGGRIRIQPNFPFLLRHHPAAWEVATEGLDGPTWLPQLCQHVLRPGVNGVRTLNENEEPHRAYEDSVSNGMKQGFTYLDPAEALPADMLPAGAVSGGYLREIPCRDLRTTAIGSRYVEAWAVPEPALPDEIQTFKFDRASYNRWRLMLVMTGVIKPPQDRVKRRLRQRMQGHLDRVKVLNLPKELREERIGIEQANVDVHAEAVAPTPAGLVAGVPVPKRPNVEALKAQLANIDNVDMLRGLLHHEDRSTARTAIEARITELEDGGH